MKMRMLTYSPLDSPLHRLSGAAKLIFFILWAVTVMVTFDTRSLLVMLLFALILLRVSRIKLRDYAFVLYLILIFFALNHLAIFLFSPLEGVSLYGTRHDLFPIAGRYIVTEEQLFYQFNVALKYVTVIPMALLFMLTTEPGEFAASLHRVGISYRIAYAVSIALRYIPDVQRDYENIACAAQARGIDISRKEKLTRRVRNMIGILLPLILTSVQRIETISAAMELRSFGQHRKRTWYNGRPFTWMDYFVIILIILIAAVSTYVTFQDGSRFYNPFQ
ncbi:energy-coupling factor transport system permease protein [Paenibacillus cellulosilyticus]|uniref:Energy-coupling factor transport system permease protein n=1 Tax=Paenibacillus cellulosilyticus TaxID=375489 RepID=A0A2V2YQC4_9BACL|nr:energy-coupling factor transporter transmembrane component T [Paenibacillus cellulosilyticus]PWV98648.1 energy-coupling factor transport system permease protein [Paenibacillus cellulosilyticus]QKS43839.1 energy-coupling factor transporter transmembrane protein EcfT [Paenibacillus cellulosilyticus]